MNSKGEVYLSLLKKNCLYLTLFYFDDSNVIVQMCLLSMTSYWNGWALFWMPGKNLCDTWRKNYLPWKGSLLVLSPKSKTSRKGARDCWLASKPFSTWWAVLTSLYFSSHKWGDKRKNNKILKHFDLWKIKKIKK